MTESEFRKAIVYLGFRIETSPGAFYIGKRTRGYYGEVTLQVATVSRAKQFEMDMLGYRDLFDMDLDLKEKVFDTISEFARTPMEER